MTRLPTFRYATLDSVKGRIPAALLTSAALTDAAILEQIEEASAMVNLWTQQVFQPYPDVVRSSARGDQIITHPSRYPVVLIRALAEIENRTTGEFKEMDRIIPGLRYDGAGERGVNTLTLQRSGDGLIVVGGSPNCPREAAWDSGERHIPLITLFGGYTKGWKNIELTGWWGWLENYKNVDMELVTTAIPANDATIVTIDVVDIVDPVTGDCLEVGDTIAIPKKTVAGASIPTEVELANILTISGTGPYTLTFDTLHPVPVEIPVGAVISAYGRIPSGVQTVTAYLAKKLVLEYAYDFLGNVVGQASANGTLKSERVDEYAYTLGDSSGGGSGGAQGLGKHTGSARMDLVLRKFARPTMQMRYF